jgi:hypothetical protein
MREVCWHLGELRWRGFDDLYTVAQHLSREAAFVYTLIYTVPDVPHFHSVRLHTRTEGAPSHGHIRSVSACSVRRSCCEDGKKLRRTVQAALSWKEKRWHTEVQECDCERSIAERFGVDVRACIANVHKRSLNTPRVLL